MRWTNIYILGTVMLASPRRDCVHASGMCIKNCSTATLATVHVVYV